MGKIPNLTNIFQRGWFNHQLAMLPWSLKQQKDIPKLEALLTTHTTSPGFPRFLTSVESDHRHEVRWVVEPVKFQELLWEFIAKCTPKKHNTFFFLSHQGLYFMIRKYIDQQQELIIKPYMIWNYRCCHVYIYEFLSLSYPAGSLRKTPQPPADGLVPLGRCGGLPWAPWALAWHLAWLFLPWRRGMRVTPFLRWLPGRWMTVQCSCWKNRQKYQKDAISGWVFKQF